MKIEPEFNQRQLELMIQLIDGFNNGNVTLSDLSFSLEGLLNILENVTDKWRQEFLHEWGKIEDARADLQFRSAIIVDTDTKQRVRDAGENIKNLILRGF
ncbi:MAG: hypothetical protein ACYC5H_06610 [Methylovirgula sp.]